MTYDEFLDIAFALPDVEESLYYGQPTIKRGKRFMFALKADGETVAMKLPWDSRNHLLDQQPEHFFLTPHYEEWPYVLIRFEQIEREQAQELIKTAWEDAPLPAKRRR
ncbi:MAG: MmcQ/YjbR family DNA-binding protein [Fimbriimonadaceae bacterium]